MKPIVNSILILFQIVSVFLCFCCTTQDGKSIETRHKQLDSLNLFKLLEDVAVEPYPESNFHVFYKEYLNDSSWVLNILQNDFLGNESLGICEVLNLKGHHVFIYDEMCHKQLRDSIKATKNEGPFQFDGISFQLLVEERSNRLEYYTLKRRFKFDDSTEPIDSTLIKFN